MTKPTRSDVVFWFGIGTLAASMLHGNAWEGAIAVLVVATAVVMDHLPRRSDPTHDELKRLALAINALNLKVGMKPFGEK